MKQIIDKQIGKQILVSLNVIQKAIDNLREVVEKAMNMEEVDTSKNMKTFLDENNASVRLMHSFSYEAYSIKEFIENISILKFSSYRSVGKKTVNELKEIFEKYNIDWE